MNRIFYCAYCGAKFHSSVIRKEHQGKCWVRGHFRRGCFVRTHIRRTPSGGITTVRAHKRRPAIVRGHTRHTTAVHHYIRGCPHCHTQVKKYHNYCKSCGTLLPWAPYIFEGRRGEILQRLAQRKITPKLVIKQLLKHPQGVDFWELIHALFVENHKQPDFRSLLIKLLERKRIQFRKKRFYVVKPPFWPRLEKLQKHEGKTPSQKNILNIATEHGQSVEEFARRLPLINPNQNFSTLMKNLDRLVATGRLLKKTIKGYTTYYLHPKHRRKEVKKSPRKEKSGVQCPRCKKYFPTREAQAEHFDFVHSKEFKRTAKPIWERILRVLRMEEGWVPKGTIMARLNWRLMKDLDLVDRIFNWLVHRKEIARRRAEWDVEYKYSGYRIYLR